MYKYHKDGTLPQNGEVFVFGSNLAGIHGAGAAKVAHEKFGAVYGRGVGMQPNNKSYAIPTKGTDLRFALTLDQIKKHIAAFVEFTHSVDSLVKDTVYYSHEGFFVTRVGCGFAGYRDEEIAPLFRDAKNCSFALQWKIYLETEELQKDEPEIFRLAKVVDESLQKHPEKIEITPEYIERLMKGRI